MNLRRKPSVKVKDWVDEYTRSIERQTEQRRLQELRDERERLLVAEENQRRRERDREREQLYLKNGTFQSFFSNSSNSTYDWPPVQGSGGTGGLFEDWLKATSGTFIGLRKGEMKVKDATFQTLVLTYEGIERTVIWFEGEGLPEVLERLAQQMR